VPAVKKSPQTAQPAAHAAWHDAYASGPAFPTLKRHTTKSIDIASLKLAKLPSPDVGLIIWLNPRSKRGSLSQFNLSMPFELNFPF